MPSNSLVYVGSRLQGFLKSCLARRRQGSLPAGRRPGGARGAFSVSAAAAALALRCGQGWERRGLGAEPRQVRGVVASPD
jgi:hypothetical protein